MPISDPEGYETGHFKRVYFDIFKPAIERAGFVPHRADEKKGSNLIQLEILKNLIEAPLALCDLSTRNPNVLFELGIRQAFDKPVVLVQEMGTPKIFDINPLRFTEYRRERVYHEVLEDQKKIHDALKETIEDTSSINSIVRLLSLHEPAGLPDMSGVKDNPMLQLVLSELEGIKKEIRVTQNRVSRLTQRANDKHTPFSKINEYEHTELSNIKNELTTMIADNSMDLKMLDHLKTRLENIASQNNNSLHLSEITRLAASIEKYYAMIEKENSKFNIGIYG